MVLLSRRRSHALGNKSVHQVLAQEVAVEVVVLVERALDASVAVVPARRLGGRGRGPASLSSGAAGGARPRPRLLDDPLDLLGALRRRRHQRARGLASVGELLGQVLQEPRVLLDAGDRDAVGGVAHEDARDEVDALARQVQRGRERVLDAHDALDRLAEVARVGGVLEGVGPDEHDVEGDAAWFRVCVVVVCAGGGEGGGVRGGRNEDEERERERGTAREGERVS